MTTPAIAIPHDELAVICSKWHIRKLSLFGSVLRDDFGPDSDIDVLVEFEPDCIPGYEIITIQDELSAIFGDRTVDLVMQQYLNR